MDKVTIHPSADVSLKASLGAGTRIWHHCHIRENVRIGKNCIFGKDVYVDFGVKIGSGVKIQNGVSIYHGVTIEDGVFLGPHMVFTNDLFPRSFNSNFKVYKTLVKKGASIGANATIICGITIGEYAMVGAGSVVTKDVPPHALVVGNPARIIGFICVCAGKLKEDNSPKMYCQKCGRRYTIKQNSKHQSTRNKQYPNIKS